MSSIGIMVLILFVSVFFVFICNLIPRRSMLVYGQSKAGFGYIFSNLDLCFMYYIRKQIINNGAVEHLMEAFIQGST